MSARSPPRRRFAAELGRAFAGLHGSVTPAEAEALGVPARGPFPPPGDLRRRLSGRLPEPALEPVLDVVLEGYAAMGGDEAGRVLTHGDPWAGNLATDPGAGRLAGMFDFEDVALDDRHADFRFLHSFGDAFAERVLDAYAAASGVRPSIRRAALYHALAAFEALSGAMATGDPDKVAYRLGWVRDALARAPGRLLGLRAARSGALLCAGTQVKTETPPAGPAARPRRPLPARRKGGRLTAAPRRPPRPAHWPRLEPQLGEAVNGILAAGRTMRARESRPLYAKIMCRISTSPLINLKL